MDASSATHPTNAQLQDYALGRLDAAAFAALLAHLDDCPACRDRVARLPSQVIDSVAICDDRTPAPNAAAQQALSAGIPPELAALTGYADIRELGRGGMGVVYLARNKDMDRLEVLKTVNRASIGASDAVERFRQEIRSAGRLLHPNVATAFGVLTCGDFIVLVMEYVEGEDLGKVVQRRGALPIPHSCYYAFQAALGLQHAHENGLVHRDVKPGNLLLNAKKNIVKVVDFGLAKALAESTRSRELTGTGMVLGTPHYIAPEQVVESKAADIRADVYSLGCTLYCLLAGRPPFQRASTFDLLLAHRTEAAPPLRQVRPEAPAELEAVVAKMMAKEPAERYQTPGEAAQALRPYAKSGTGATVAKTPAATVSPVRRTAPKPSWVETMSRTDKPKAKAPPKWRPRRGWRTQRVMVGVVAVVLAIAGIIFVAATSRPRPSDSAIAVEKDRTNGPATKGGEPAQPPTITHKAGMKLVRVPAGTFKMGSPDSDGEAESNEKPQRDVEITRPFYLGKYEVTRGQFRRFVEADNYKTDGAEAAPWDKVSFAQTDEHPVVNVQWHDAVAFCNWLSKQEGRRPCYQRAGASWECDFSANGYRLPTEAEWEYACRARTMTTYHFGATPSAAQANIDDKLGGTTPVGKYAANAFGLYDMHGNAWEWCNDWYGDRYYEKGDNKDPKGPNTGTSRVLRGGSWDGLPGDCRAAFRSRIAPVDRLSSLGFRVVVSRLD